jgi:dienelactone hydrolase
MHGCNGLNQGGWGHALQWAYWVNRQGLAALILDSFSPRRLDNICGEGRKLPGRERAQDLAAAARYLTSTPDLAADGIAAIGFSHGGWTVVEAAFEPAGAQYKALIAFYPHCNAANPRTSTAPLLILAGSQDDWTASEPCARLAAQNAPGAPEVRVKIYPDARHSFDVNRPPHRYFGHFIEYNKAADEDARTQIAQFLQERLGSAGKP